MPAAQIILLASLVAAAIPNNAVANCEAGGYGIHTIAEYKKPDPRRVFLLYHREESGEILAETAGTEEALTAIAGPLRIEFGSTACTTTSGLSLDPKGPDDPNRLMDPYRFPIRDCDAVMRRIPTRGYLLLDTVAKSIRFPREMRVDESPASASQTQRIGDFVREDLRTRILYLSTYGREAEQQIAPDSIDGSRAEITTIGRGAHQLVVYVEVLRIKGNQFALNRAIAPAELSPSELDHYMMTSGKNDFPVLYFKHPSRSNPMFIGDGSQCAWARYEKYPEPQGGAEGFFDRFRVTSAFDFDLDRTADVLEVNGRFAYWIDGSGVPEVIHLGMGC